MGEKRGEDGETVVCGGSSTRWRDVLWRQMGHAVGVPGCVVRAAAHVAGLVTWAVVSALQEQQEVQWDWQVDGCIHEKSHLTPKKWLQKVSQRFIVVSGVLNNISKVYHSVTTEKV